MPHRMLRSAATVLLASAPLFAPVPAQAAAQQGFPCDVGIEKEDGLKTSKVTITIACDETRTVSTRIAVGDSVLKNRQTVQAGVEQSFTATVNKVPQVCATFETDGETTTACAT
ncbi:hypothetical protein [Streptomyces ureilyticus]|uniref:Uncharacterized protein n=1 Tax=Streptomyces ureilyticus TaxID=1775131 RepID=A0ABX0E059_9ACTN|nr:hypothetical protein [Streptomyces ureilyticus]NGO46574.1 hypothetical protein [Streptomyces ureilyticus]